MKFYIIALLFPVIISSQKKMSDIDLIPVKSHEKWGFVDKKMKFIILPQYDDVDFFYQYKYYEDPKSRDFVRVDVAKVNVDKKEKCIKPDNSELNCKKIKTISEENSPLVRTSTIGADEYEKQEKKKKQDEENFVQENFPEASRNNYDNVEVFYKESLFFMVKKNNLYGIVNKQNQIIIPVNYGYIQRTGYGNKLMFFTMDYKNKLFELFSERGKSVLKMTSLPTPLTNDGVLLVNINNEKPFRIFDLKSEKFINNKSYDKNLGCSSNGFCRVQRANKEFYVDGLGNEYIKK